MAWSYEMYGFDTLFYFSYFTFRDQWNEINEIKN